MKRQQGLLNHDPTIEIPAVRQDSQESTEVESVPDAARYAGTIRRSSDPMATKVSILSFAASASTDSAPAHTKLTKYQSSSFDGWLMGERLGKRRLKRSAAAIQLVRTKWLPLQFVQQPQSLAMLSQYMEAKIYEKIRTSLGEKYGSLERATQAAVIIQKAYRGYNMKKRFDEICREGSCPRSRLSSVVAKVLPMVKQEAVDLPDIGSMTDVSDDVVLSDICNKQCVLEGGPLKPDALTEDGSWVHHHLGSPRACGVSSVLRRSKSLTSPLTRIVLVEDWEEEGEDETAPWNRMVGVYLFNRKPASGIQYLISEGIVSDTPKSVARFLREQVGLSKLKIGEFVGEIRYEFNMAVLEHLAYSINMKDKPIDEALREFQTLFLMPGEAQKIDKIMQIFARQYINANNPQFWTQDSTHILSELQSSSANHWDFKTEDAVYILSFSIMMLHTSLHNPSVKNRDSKEQWIKMNQGINGGGNFSKQFLLEIYDRIQQTSFATGHDHTQKVVDIQKHLVGSDILKQSAPHRCFVDEVTVYELDKVNSWKRGKHKRVLLMFNDLVVVTKKNKEQYMFKQSFSLLNATAVSYQSADLPGNNGIQIYSSMDGTLLFQCCCMTTLECETLLKNLNDSIKLLNLLEKERIRASQEQPHHHEMKAGDLHPTLHPLSKAKSEGYLPGIQSSLLRPLSASNLSMAVDNLNQLGNVSMSVGKGNILSASLSNVTSVGDPSFGTEGPSFDGTEGPSFDGTEDPSFDGTEGPSFDGTEGPSFDGTEGPSFDGTEGSSFDGTEGPSFGRTEDPSFDGMENSSFGTVISPLFDDLENIFQIACHTQVSKSDQNRGKLDRSLCDVDQLIPYTFCTNAVNVIGLMRPSQLLH